MAWVVLDVGTSERTAFRGDCRICRQKDGPFEVLAAHGASRFASLSQDDGTARRVSRREETGEKRLA
jgi:hypothetical protein